MKNINWKLARSILVACLLLVLPRSTLSAAGSHYYLHVESFRTEKSAQISVKNYKRKGIAAIIRKERVAKLGDWYRVYIGPFPSREAARQKATELKKKGIIKYADIKRLDSRAAPATAVSAPVIKETVKTPPPKPMDKVQQSQPTAAPKTSIQVAAAPAPKKDVKKTADAPAPETKSPRLESNTIRGGEGRNLNGGSVLFGLSHISREINTLLTERNGAPPDAQIKNSFPTTIHQTTLSIGVGLTDYIEIFGQGGVAYDDYSDPGTVFGGGLRFNLFQVSNHSRLPGFYSALFGEYLSGDFDDEYTSAAGNLFTRKSEWQELSAGLEIGISRSNWDVYLGGYYFEYSEETERRGPSQLFRDKLEQQDNVGVYGGFSLRLFKIMVLNLEGHGLAQQAVSASLEFRF